MLGNDAGDADSIISAITLAYIESMKRGKSITPVVSISKDVFVHERPDIVRAFELAGIQSASEKLIFIEDFDDIVVGNSADITLVDHNTLNSSLRHSIRKKLIVMEILDHHIDEGKYLKTCADDHRNIAFRDGQPLVASTSTLVAEKLQLLFDSPYPPSIGILLLGVILLDSVNLDVTIGKVTDRDRVSVEDLLVNTDWSNMTVPVAYRKSDGVIAVDTTELFNELQLAKYNPQFWSDISVTRALGYDVKYFHQIGISTILMPATLFMEKSGFVESTLAFIGTGHVSLLVIMFAFYDEDDSFRRQLAFISTDQHVDVRLLVESLLSSDSYKLVDLQLSDVAIPAEFDDSFQIILFDQKNVSPSRKEIGPMLEDFFNKSDSRMTQRA